MKKLQYVLILMLLGSMIFGSCAITETVTETVGGGALSDQKVRSKDGMVLVEVPKGEFTMGTSLNSINYALDQSGCTECVADWYSGEIPGHQVTLDAYWIDKYEVSIEKFVEFLNKNDFLNEASVSELIHLNGGDDNIYLLDKWYAKDGFGDFPVTDITFFGAAAYCEWTGGRLPTEAEWEKAARGDDRRIYPWGNDAPENAEFSNYNNLLRGPVSVTSYEDVESPYGTVNMAGNVWEWTSDYYFYEAYNTGSNHNPSFPNSSDSQNMVVIRGGSYINHDMDVRTTRRGKAQDTDATQHLGFRCVMP